MTRFTRALSPLAMFLALGLAVPAQAASAEFRVLPYQLTPTEDGITITWFSSDPMPGTLTVTGPGLDQPAVFASQPELVEVLDYQVAAELNAQGEFPFATTAIFDADGNPARNYRHRIVLTGLRTDSLYAYEAAQGVSTYANTFRTAPDRQTDRTMRFAVLSDSETLVRGRTRFREWARTTPQALGSTGRPDGSGRGRDQYFLSETVGYQENIRQIKGRNPDLIIMPGDIVEGTGNEQQRRWDEFWRHNAGQYDDLLSGRPLVAAIGNNCIFAGVGAGETGSGGPLTNELISYARQQFSAYLSYPSNGNAAFQDLYHRQDYGPVTIITLCSVKATDEANSRVAPPVGQGISVNFPQNLDTNRAWFSTPYAPGDIPDFNQGTEQWDWAMAEMAAARDAGQIIFVQFHHTPFSRGIHGSSVTSNQSGEAMRIYAPMMEQYRVAGVFAGHSEVSEMSFFDTDGDGYGVHLWDVGAAGDGLRGVEDAAGFVNNNIVNWRANPLNTDGQAWVANPFHVWAADQNEAELWNGNQLVSGGKHYGFLEVDVEPRGDDRFRIAFRYLHNFPLNAGDVDFTVTGYELRPYQNRVTLEGPADNLRPVPACSAADLATPYGVLTFADVATFLDAYDAQDPAADLASPIGVFSFSDVAAFLAAFSAGCP